MSKILTNQFRLAEVQLYNWGTFEGLHTVTIAREGFLITGPSGSGKSTLIDAVSAVMVPPAKLKFNSAADAATKSGRDLISYCRGAWRREHSSELDELTQSFLRPGATWSGVLLRYDDGTGTSVSAVRVMFLNSKAHSNAEIKNLFVMLPRAASLTEFKEVATDELNTATAKKKFPDALAIQRNHAPFISTFQRHLGIADSGALDLLHRTQSAKSLGDLNNLMRNFMLPEPETFTVAKEAVENFTELQAAYEMVVTARTQIEHLQPIRTAVERVNEIAATARTLEEDQGNLDVFTHGRVRGFALERRKELQAELESVNAQGVAINHDLEALRRRQNTIQTQIHGEEGTAIVSARHDRDNANRELARVEIAEKQFATRLKTLDASMPATLEEFTELQLQLRDALTDSQANEEKLSDDLSTVDYANKELLKDRSEAKEELASVRKFQSAMDPKLLHARERICEAVGIRHPDLPFIADLIQISPEHTKWQPVAERVMSSFARTMLVPEEHYKDVSAVINDMNVRVHLRYTRFSSDLEHRQPGKFKPHSLGTKISVREGRFHGYLQSQLSTKFDYTCCESIEEFHHERRAVTLKGQVKHDRYNHVKDDRHRIDDMSRWVLSGNVDEKIELLQSKLRGITNKLSELDKRKQYLDEIIGKERNRQQTINRLLETTEFDVIDIRKARTAAEEAQRVLDSRVDGNEKLHELRQALKNIQAEVDQKDDARLRLATERGTLSNKLDDVRKQLDEADRVLASSPPPSEESTARLERRFTTFSRTIRADNITSLKDRAAESLHKEIRTLTSQKTTQENNARNAMSKYVDRWPNRRGDLTPELEWTHDFVAELERLESDDLPRFEERFRDFLQEQTTKHLGRLRRLIREATSKTRSNIESINDSLSLVEFYPNTFLKIEVRDAQPAIAREFINLLDNAMEGTLVDPDPAESEQRFAKLEKVIDAIEISDNTTPRERRLRLDTREHVKFLGVEVDADGARGAVYDSSQGLSGGQAQKLSSFCLAAALRYRLCGMGQSSSSHAKNSVVTIDGNEFPKFGSIILDEAFDRADADFTRAAMDAFTQFGFHMILATPEKLLQTIQEYIGGVLLVECPDRRFSRTSALSIEEAHDEIS